VHLLLAMFLNKLVSWVRLFLVLLNINTWDYASIVDLIGPLIMATLRKRSHPISVFSVELVILMLVLKRFLIDISLMCIRTFLTLKIKLC
jgi:hypothetical protein